MIEGITKVVIVAGAQRSGTTLVGQILGAHPKAFLLDEPDGVYDWFDAEINGKSTPASDAQLLEAAGAKYGRGQRRLKGGGDRIRLAPGVTHLVLKAPNLTHRFEDFSRLGKPVTVVFPVRDPRAVVASMAKLRHQRRMADRQTGFLSGHPHLQAAFADELALLDDEAQPLHVRRALIWRLKTMLHEQIRLAGFPTFSFRYEDLIADRERTVAALADHVGLDVSPEMLAHEEIYKGFGPGLTDRRRPVDATSVEAWRDRLSPEETDDVVRIARRDMEALGYTIESDPLSAPAVVGKVSERELRSPVVLVGRGGSGTRLLSELGQQAGLFLGNRLNKSQDSAEWVDLIYEIALSGLTPAAEKLDPEIWDRLLLAKAAHVLGSGSWVPGQPWGWKLPETMLVLPQVCRTFSESKVVHLVRHPVDSSLRRTHKTSRLDDVVGKRVIPAAYEYAGLLPRDRRADEGWRHNAVTWLFQVKPVMQFGREQLGPARYMELRYEDVCADPAAAWRPVAAFLGLPFVEPSLPDLDGERMRSYAPDDPRISNVWSLCGETAISLGYDTPVPA